MGREYFSKKIDNAYVCIKEDDSEDLVVGQTYYMVFNDNTEEGNCEVYECWETIEDDMDEHNFIWVGEPDLFEEYFEQISK